MTVKKKTSPSAIESRRFTRRSLRGLDQSEKSPKETFESIERKIFEDLGNNVITKRKSLNSKIKALPTVKPAILETNNVVECEDRYTIDSDTEMIKITRRSSRLSIPKKTINKSAEKKISNNEKIKQLEVRKDIECKELAVGSLSGKSRGSKRKLSTAERSIVKALEQDGDGQKEKDLSELSSIKTTNKKAKNIANSRINHGTAMTKQPKDLPVATSSMKSSRSRDMKKPPSKKQLKESEPASDSEMSDWEAVDHHLSKTPVINASNEVNLLTKDNTVSKGEEEGTSHIQIELDGSLLWGIKRRKKKSREAMMFDYIRRYINNRIRAGFINAHKVHLLSLLAHGLHLNQVLSSDEMKSTALSIVTEEKLRPPKRVGLRYIETLLKWFHTNITVEDGGSHYRVYDWRLILLKRFEEKSAKLKKEIVLMFIVICRTLGIDIRLVQSLAPCSYKVPADKLFKPVKYGAEKNNPPPVIHDITPKDHTEKVIKSRKMISSDSEDADNSENKKKLKYQEEDFSSSSNFSDDSDFDEPVRKNKKSNQLRPQTTKFLEKNERVKLKSVNKKRISVPSKSKKELAFDWVEIYIDDMKKWVCVDVLDSKVTYATEIAAKAHSICYVTAFNNDGSVKDVTKRYDTKWLTNEKKLRCDTEWWADVLLPYAPKLNKKEKEENNSLESQLKEQPLPKTISEYKNHPMYALQRHLLKFEALYPPNPDPVGMIRGEPVFPRECVRTLHSRDVWLKQAKTVQVDEEAYKVVKAMPKWDRVACKLIKDRPLDLFGEWQVEDYKPPVAQDGKVPRNEYGNVELFKAEMLPIGCVHMDAEYEDLSRICRKMKVDCAPAMVGFDFHKGGTHPVFNGYVICEEVRDMVIDTWKEEMELKRKREKFRRERRVLDNWKKLTKNLLIKHHLKEVYGDYEVNSDGDLDVSNVPAQAKKKTTKTGSRKVIKQKDIESQKSSSTAPEEKVMLGIDLKSDTVSMAKKCFTNARNGLSSHVDSSRIAKRKMLDSSDDDEENKLTEKEKQENLRKILNWGKTAATVDALGLSDESGDEEKPLKGKEVFQTSFFGIDTKIPGIKKLKKSSNHFGRKSLCKKSSEAVERGVTDGSCTDDSLADFDLLSSSLVRRPRREAAKRAKIVVESEEEDISIGESDLEDKTYVPVLGTTN